MASKNTLKIKEVGKGLDGQAANSTLNRNHLSGPLVVDPVSQQLIDSRYISAFFIDHFNLSLINVTLFFAIAFI